MADETAETTVTVTGPDAKKFQEILMRALKTLGALEASKIHWELSQERLDDVHRVAASVRSE